MRINLRLQRHDVGFFFLRLILLHLILQPFNPIAQLIVAMHEQSYLIRTFHLVGRNRIVRIQILQVLGQLRQRFGHPLQIIKHQSDC
ncbi:hypothetical protein D3C73_1343880 [compost metagenome]